MSRQGSKQALFTQFAAVAKRSGTPQHLEPLEQLAQGGRSVELLADRTGLSHANASRHRQHMRRAGLVTNRRDGKIRYYRLADDAVSMVAATHRDRNTVIVAYCRRPYCGLSLEAVAQLSKLGFKDAQTSGRTAGMEGGRPARRDGARPTRA